MTVPSATIVVGTVSPDNDGAKFDSDPTIDPDFIIETEYMDDEQILMLPVASPDGFSGKTAVFVQLAAPTFCWKVDWTAARIGAKPEVPSSVPADKNWVLMKRKVEPANMVQMGDGATPYWRISGTYWYGHRVFRGNFLKTMAFPRPPWLMDVFDRSVEPSMFEKSLMDQTGSGGTGSASPGSTGGS